MEEEDTFWLMCAIIEDLLPASYFSSTLLGIQVCAFSSPIYLLYFHHVLKTFLCPVYRTSIYVYLMNASSVYLLSSIVVDIAVYALAFVLCLFLA